MTVYKLLTDDGACYVSADLSQASAAISVYFGSDPWCDGADDDGISWSPTQYQTADVKYDEDDLAALVAKDCDLGAVKGIAELDAPIRSVTLVARGGTTFAGVAHLADGSTHEFRGETFENGEIAEDGQWIEGDQDLDDAAREAFDLDWDVKIIEP